METREQAPYHMVEHHLLLEEWGRKPRLQKIQLKRPGTTILGNSSHQDGINKDHPTSITLVVMVQCSNCSKAQFR